MADTAKKAAQINAQECLELEGVANVLHFLHNTQPIDGCDYQDDDAFKGGRAEILEWLERRVRTIGARDAA